MDRVAIYVRVSRDEKNKNYESIVTQKNLLIKYVEKNNLGKVYKIYTDNGVSGAVFERRGIKELKEDVINKNINIVLIKDLSRLGRNNAKTLLFLDYLEENDIRIITYDGRYDSLKDNETVGIDTWYNERYIRDISKKIRANIRYKKENGEHLGNAPFGYKKSPEKKNYLIVDHAKKEIVKEIFYLYKEGYGYLTIANILNKRKVQPPSKSNTNIWSPISIRRILNNRVYLGDTVQGVSERISFKNRKTKYIPKSNWIITQNTHEPIIKEEIFLDVQSIRESKIKNYGAHKGKIHLFRGVLYCGDCGSSMFARTHKGKGLGYICSKYSKKGKEVCDRHFVEELPIKQKILEEIRNFLSIDAIKEKVIGLINESIDDVRFRIDCIENLDNQIYKKEGQIEQLYVDKLNGNISNEIFQKIYKRLEHEIEELKKKIQELDKIQKEVDKTPKILFEDMLANLGDYLSNEFIKLVVRRISVYNKKESNELSADIIFNFKHIC